jgi:hypothetical protein
MTKKFRLGDRTWVNDCGKNVESGPVD